MALRDAERASWSARLSLVRIPKRAHQLTVVVRRECGPGPADEEVLRTFPAPR